MIAITCQHEKLTKHGKDRKGVQRWKCAKCDATVTNGQHVRPLGDMRTDTVDAARVLRMLLEGMSIRACERITGMKAATITASVYLDVLEFDVVRTLWDGLAGAQGRAGSGPDFFRPIHRLAWILDNASTVQATSR